MTSCSITRQQPVPGSHECMHPKSERRSHAKGRMPIKQANACRVAEQGGVVHCMHDACKLGCFAARSRSRRCMLSTPQKSKGPREAISFSKSTRAHLSQPRPASHQLNPEAAAGGCRLSIHVHAMHLNTPRSRTPWLPLTQQDRVPFQSLSLLSHG